MVRAVSEDPFHAISMLLPNAAAGPGRHRQDRLPAVEQRRFQRAERRPTGAFHRPADDHDIVNAGMVAEIVEAGFALRPDRPVAQAGSLGEDVEAPARLGGAAVVLAFEALHKRRQRGAAVVGRHDGGGVGVEMGGLQPAVDAGAQALGGGKHALQCVQVVGRHQNRFHRLVLASPAAAAGGVTNRASWASLAAGPAGGARPQYRSKEEDAHDGPAGPPGGAGGAACRDR